MRTWRQHYEQEVAARRQAEKLLREFDTARLTQRNAELVAQVENLQGLVTQYRLANEDLQRRLTLVVV